MKTMTIRGMDQEMVRRLRNAAEESGTSVNAAVLKLLRRALHIEKEVPFPEHHDLDSLAGTWSEEDRKKFDEFQKGFGKVDEDLWR